MVLLITRVSTAHKSPVSSDVPRLSPAVPGMASAYDDDCFFITFKSSLVPLFEGLWSSNSWEFELSGFNGYLANVLGKYRRGYAGQTWGLATWPVAAEGDCPWVFYKATPRHWNEELCSKVGSSSKSGYTTCFHNRIRKSMLMIEQHRMIEITFNGSHVRTIRSHFDNANDQKQKYGWYKGSNLEGLKISDLT